MNYKVLYRKYRPENFDEIIGQDYIIDTLKNSIISHNLSHAYIFSGPRGTGKTTTAKVFAKAINCANPVGANPCGKCDFCLHFNENPDIIELDAASNNGVDEIREIIDNVKLAPTNGKYKVYIIDEAHMLTTSAFNALLLTLEEPPLHSIFILATTNVENIPITILSRCQRYDFKKIAIPELVSNMKRICEKEKIKIEDKALVEIANIAEGGMRDALSLLDQLSKSEDVIALEYVEEHMRIVSETTIEELLDMVERNDIESCLNLIDNFRKKGFDYKNLVKRLIENATIRAKDIQLTGKIKRLSFSDYKKMIIELIDSLNRININVDAYTSLEMILLTFLNTSDIANDSDEKEIAKEKIINSNNIINDEWRNVVSKRINNCFYGAQKKYLEENKKYIQNILQYPDIDGKIKGILFDSTLVASSDKNMIFTINNEHKVINANKMLKEIEDFISKEIKEKYKVIFITDEEWKKEKEEYINNLKNKKVYEYIEEDDEKDEDETLLNDVFDKAKIEIV